MKSTYRKLDPKKPNGDIGKVREEVLNWFVNGDTGSSSKVLAAAAAGIEVNDGVYVPRDPSDFIRCLDMLKACPSINNLESAKDMYPSLAPYVDNWNEMVEILESDTESSSKVTRSDLYAVIKRRMTESFFLQDRILSGMLYMSISEFEKEHGVKVTLENVHECVANAKRKLGLKDVG
jgi:hypothetical protein